MPPGHQKAEEILGFSEKNVRNWYVCSSGCPENLSRGMQRDVSGIWGARSDGIVKDAKTVLVPVLALLDIT